MTIKEKTVYDYKLEKKDVESLANTINLLYQFRNNPEAWDEIKKNAVSISLKNISLTDMITTLEEIGGKEYQKFIRKVSLWVRTF